MLCRLTGISIPIFGVSWTPPADERKLAEEAVTYLENQGVLYAPFEWEHPKDAYDSAGSMRTELTTLMQKLPRRSAKVSKRLATSRIVHGNHGMM